MSKTFLGKLFIWVALTGASLLAGAEELVLEEVIVTAQKRTEALSRTPMTVNVVTGQQIAEFAAFSLYDLNNMVAGLTISGSHFDTDVATRGLGTDLNAPVSPRVAMYLDGVLIDQQRGLFSGLYDLEQFQLLRGPQGTVYGQSSPAGAMTIRSRDPNLEDLDGYLQQSLTDRDGSNSQLGLSIPLIPGELGIRVSGLYDTNEHSDVRNITLGKDHENETTAFRIVGLWEPNDRFSARLSYHDIDDEFDIDPVVSGNGIDFDDRKAVADFESEMENESNYTIGEINYRFANDWTATLVASIQDNKVSRYWDDDGSEVRGGEQLVISDAPDLENYEFRLASQDTESWDWTFGLYYQDAESDTPIFVDTYIAAAPGFTILARTTGPALNEAETFGVFSHNTIYLTDKSTLTLGLRYNDNERTNKQDFTTDIYQVLPDDSRVFLASLNQEGVLPEDQEVSDDAFTGTLKYRYQFSDQLMAYASYDRGWRDGSVNIAGRPQPPVFGAFDSEDSDNLEIGFKWGLLNGRGLLNVAAYYQLYSDFQYQADSVQFRATEGDIQLTDPVVNVDEAESYGIDTEFSILLSETWTLSATVTWNETELTDAGNVPCTDGEPVGNEPWSFNTCDLEGERAGDQPEWSANLASEYWRPFDSLEAEWYLRGLLNAESEYYSNGFAEDLDSYAMLDLFLGLRAGSGKWDASLWVKNLFDETAELDTRRLNPIPDYQNGGSIDSGYVRIERQLQPRTAGVTARYNF